MRLVQARLAVFGLAITGLATVGATAPAFAEGSYVDALQGSFTSQGTGTLIQPVGRTGYSGGAPYSTHSSVLLFDEAIGLVSKGAIIGEAAIEATGMAMHASNAASHGALTVEADTTIASAEVLLNLLPPTGPTPPPLLKLTASGISNTLTDVQTLPLPSVQTGITHFTTLTLTGSLVGGKTLTFTGDAPANTVLYDDQYLTVTLNQQIVTGMIECTPTCTFVPLQMAANAIAIQMNKEPIAGKPANGNFFIGQTLVTLP